MPSVKAGTQIPHRDLDDLKSISISLEAGALGAIASALCAGEFLPAIDVLGPLDGIACALANEVSFRLGLAGIQPASLSVCCQPTVPPSLCRRRPSLFCVGCGPPPLTWVAEAKNVGESSGLVGESGDRRKGQPLTGGGSSQPTQGRVRQGQRPDRSHSGAVPDASQAAGGHPGIRER